MAITAHLILVGKVEKEDFISLRFTSFVFIWLMSNFFVYAYIYIILKCVDILYINFLAEFLT